MNEVQRVPQEETIEYLSVHEFAAAIGRSARSVQRYVRQGRLHAVKTPTGAILIPQVELKHFGKGGAARPATTSRHRSRLQEVGGRFRVMGSSDPPPPSGEPTPSLGLAAVPLGRHEEMILRLGWTEGQLELTRRLMEEARQQVDDLERRLEAEVESRLAAQERIRQLEARIRCWEER